MTESEKKKLKRFGLTRLNKPKRTPSHKSKKGIVATKVNGKLNAKLNAKSNAELN